MITRLQWNYEMKWNYAYALKKRLHKYNFRTLCDHIRAVLWVEDREVRDSGSSVLLYQFVVEWEVCPVKMGLIQGHFLLSGLFLMVGIILKVVLFSLWTQTYTQKYYPFRNLGFNWSTLIFHIQTKPPNSLEIMGKFLIVNNFHKN